MTVTPPADASPRPGDLIGVALGSLAAGAMTGAGAVAAGLALLRGHVRTLLPLLVFAAIAIAAATAWRLARPITDWWRRGLTAVLAVFVGVLLLALTAPADMLAGRAGLAVFALLLLTAAGLTARHVLRSARDDG